MFLYVEGKGDYVATSVADNNQFAKCKYRLL